MLARALPRGSVALASVAALAAFGFAFGVALDGLAYARARSGRWGAPPLRARGVEAGGARGFVLEAGRGKLTILLASPLVRARTYLPLLRPLASRGRVLAVEMPGSGRAERLGAPPSVAESAAWVSALLDTLGIGAGFTLVGHSNSGAVALALAGRDARVARLVLVDTIGARKGGLLRLVLARLVDGLEEPRLSLRAAWHLGWNIARHPRALLAQVRLAGSADLLEAARHVGTPTLLAWGKRDRTMPLASAFRLLAALPRAKLAVGPGSHDWLITHPEDFVRAALGGAGREVP